MAAGVHLSLPAVAAMGSGVILLAIVWWGWPFQNYPGAKTWSLILVVVAIWDISYGVALTVFVPEYRWFFEIPILFGRTFSIPLILVFSLQYTGREELARSRWMYALVGIFVGGYLLAVTNPLHHIMWTDYHISPIVGAAAVRYTPRFYYVVAGMSYMLILIAIALFADTLARYRSLFGRQVMALIVALIIPSLANIFWLFRLGPTQHLDLTPGGHLVAGPLLTYALFQEGMFEVIPATRHKAERAALDDLASAVITVTNDGSIININTRATELMGVNRELALLSPIGEFLDVDVPPEETTFTMTDLFGDRNRYAVAVSEITSDGESTIGYTISLQDITSERLRQQRLEVLNRILRHNLRNDLNIVLGLLNKIESDPNGAGEYARRVRETVSGLMTIGEKARSVERIVAEEERSVARLDEVVQYSINEVGPAVDDCSIQFEVSEGDVPVNASLLDPVLRELIENGCAHNDADDPTVRIETTVDRSADYPITITVADNGPGIPRHELTPLHEGTETLLEHGSGLGLWLVQWGVSLLNGQLEFGENYPRGTTVIVRIPTAE